MKICNKCQINKQLSEFSLNSKSKDGHTNVCKSCKKAQDNKRYQDNKEAVLLKRKEYRKTNREKLIKYSHEYKVKNSEKIKNNMLEYRKNNKEKIKARSKQYYDKIKSENKSKSAEQSKKWRLANPDKAKILSTNSTHRRREKLNSSNLTSKDLKQWVADQHKICSYCTTDCSANYHIDHIDPLSKGGTHTLDNLTIACPSCNSSKKDMFLLNWLAKIKINK